jgi:hypothetical protein
MGTWRLQVFIYCGYCKPGKTHDFTDGFWFADREPLIARAPPHHHREGFMNVTRITIILIIALIGPGKKSDPRLRYRTGGMGERDRI